MQVLIVGSTGHLGRKIAEGLVAEGHQVISGTRSPESAVAPGSSRAVVDVLQPATLEQLPPGIDVVVDNVSGYRAGGFPRPDHERIAREGHRNLASWAADRGVAAVLISVIAADKTGPEVPHFHEKLLAEESYREAGVAGVSLRPGFFIDQEDGRIEKGIEKGVYQVIGSVDTRIAYTSTDDVVAGVKAAIAAPPTRGLVVKNVSWGNFSAREIAERLSKEHGREIDAKALPLPVFAAITAIPRLFQPGLRNLYRMLAFIASGEYVSKEKGAG